jgi:RHS repeat-associated protein
VIKETNATTGNITDYLFGDDLIKQSRAANDSYYLYDGLGSTRALSNSAGSITDTYNYESFGTLLNQTGSTSNDYLFTGEQYDSGLDNYYLRARYYDQNIGRFTQQDTYMGNSQDPVSLHKYLYANANPVYYTDPSGNISLGSVMSAVNIGARLVTTASFNYAKRTTSFTSRLIVNNFSSIWKRAAGKLNNIRGASNAIKMMQRHFKRWTNSKEYKNNISGDKKHHIELQLPSGNLKTPKTIVGRIRLGKKHNITIVKGGRSGRIFQIQYAIGGSGSKRPGGSFSFRLDRLMWDSTGKSSPSIHYHIKYNSINLDHVVPLPLK